MDASNPQSPGPGSEGIPPQDANYFPSLDGWRAVAITMVMSSHASSHWAFDIGKQGVQVFFGISGFLITSILLKEKAAKGSIAILRFFGRRAFRVLPAAYLYLFVVQIMSWLGWTYLAPSDASASAFFYRNYYFCFVGAGCPYTSHLWSLAVEEQFYLLAPFLITAAPRKRLIVLFAGLALVCGVWRALDVRFALAARYIHPDLVFHPLRTDHCFDYLAWGVVLAIVLSDPIHRESLRRRLNLGVRFGILAAFIALIYGPIPLRPSLFSMVIPLCLACTMLRTEGTLSKLLELAPVRWVGRISYSLYLWHQLFLVDSHGSVQESPLALVQWFPVNVLLAFGLAAASYYFVESPLRAWGYRWLDGRTWAQRKGVTCPPANSST